MELSKSHLADNPLTSAGAVVSVGFDGSPPSPHPQDIKNTIIKK